MRYRKSLLPMHGKFSIECPQATLVNFQVTAMKSLSFATSSFGALTSLFLALLNLAVLSSYSGSVQAAVLPRDGVLPPSNIPLDLVPKYFELMDKCNASPDTVRVNPTCHP